MAGPLSSEEIEDVVSSVRRLVSNEQRPRNLSRDLNGERLLLTPALRVVPETSPLAPLVLGAPVMEAPPPTTPKPEAGALAEMTADPAAEVLAGRMVPEDISAALEDSLAKALEMDPGPEPQVSLADPADAGVDEADFVEADDTDPEWEDEIWADPGVVSLGEAALAADEAEILSAPVPDPEPEADGAVVQADDPEAAWERGGSEWSADEPIPFVPLRRRAEHLAARLAAGEVMETPRPEADSGDVAGSEAPVVADPPAPSNARLASELLDEDGTPLSVLDEAALQEIVRQTLRAELQGDLGERITRNVRKLVRAEINRALMARDLD
jgi:hypothetical protein